MVLVNLFQLTEIPKSTVVLCRPFEPLFRGGVRGSKVHEGEQRGVRCVRGVEGEQGERRGSKVREGEQGGVRCMRGSKGGVRCMRGSKEE